MRRPRQNGQRACREKGVVEHAKWEIWCAGKHRRSVWNVDIPREKWKCSWEDLKKCCERGAGLSARFDHLSRYVAAVASVCGTASNGEESR